MSFVAARKAQTPSEYGAPAPRETSPTQSASRGAGLVLIADDTADTRNLYGLFLGNAGFAIELVADGLTAVDRATASEPDVIVMDLSMPGLDGITATERLRANPRTQRIPVILLTAYPFRAKERGPQCVDMLLTKPCLPEDLEQHIRQLLTDRETAPGASQRP
jgi:CheY-like chemotaxis protein